MKKLKALPQLSDEPSAFSALVEGVKAALVESSKVAFQVTIEGWHEVGVLVNQYIKEFHINNVSQFCTTVGQEVSRELGHRISRTAYYDAVRFANKLEEDGLSVEEVISQYGSWRRILKLYLTEGGGCNDTPKSGELVSISPPSPPSSTYEDVLLYPCPICGNRPVIRAHYPTTIAAGAAEDEWIPLCQQCHDEQHHGFVTWFDIHGRKLFKEFIYPMFRRLYETR